MSRSEHHADSSAETVSHAKRILAAQLQRCRGRENAISSKDLAYVVSAYLPAGEGIKATTVRDCVKELRRDRHLPIVSCSQGYYLIDSVEGLERQVKRINEEIATRKETKRELVKAWNRDKYE